MFILFFAKLKELLEIFLGKVCAVRVTSNMRITDTVPLSFSKVKGLFLHLLCVCKV